MADKFARDFVMMKDQAVYCPPRVAAIIFAAYIEAHLSTLLQDKMPGLNSALKERLFRPSEGAVGTLARKIDLARALDVLSPQSAKVAVLIARIRNRFAHHLEVDSFDHPEVAELVDSLPDTYLIPKLDGKFVRFEAHDRADRFHGVASDLCFEIMSQHEGFENVDIFKLYDELSPLPAISETPPPIDQEGPDPKDQ